MTAKDYCVFVYMYRDAANYKAGGQLVLEGSYTEAAEAAIRQRCDSWDHFVAEQVGVPALYAELYKYSGGPTIDDIAFHEFQHLRAATADDLATEPWGTLDELVARFCAVKSWNCRLSPHCD
ncbi:MAG TPA: hypothetical protein VFG73_06320 [Rhodanobacteraceae bacterium]|nr:hypothetical protein [Rhodanobacteraceae bacterium]